MSFDLGKIQTKKIIFEARFKKTFSYSDKKNIIAEKFLEDYENWLIDEKGIIHFIDPDKKYYVFFENGRIGFDFDLPKEASFMRGKIKKALDTYHSFLPLTEFRRIGLRFFALYPLEYKFDEAVSILEKTLYIKNSKLDQILSNKFSDLSYNNVFDKGKYRFHLQLGAVKKDEIYNRIKRAVEKEGEKEEYPDIAFFIDLDCSCEKCLFNERVDFVDKGYEENLKIIQGILEHVLEAL